MTRLTKIILVIFLLFCLALWSPWLTWKFDLLQSLGIKNSGNTASLTLTSLAGDLEVYIDGKLIENSLINPENSPFTLSEQIPAGEHHVRIVRKSAVKDAFWEYSEILEFAPGFDLNMAWELGPSKEFSSGHIIFLGTENVQTDNVSLVLECNVSDAEIKLDGIRVSDCPLEGYGLSLDKQHEVTVSAVGYETQAFNILSEDANYRKSLAGKTLYVNAHLFRQPLVVKEKND